MEPIWRIEMLGGFRASFGDFVVRRFRTQKTALLLACLALDPGRSHSREELIALLWPDSFGDAGRRCLRQELHSLRGQFDAPDLFGAAFVSDRQSVRLNRDAWSVDAEDFLALATLRHKDSPEDQMSRLQRAAALYGGELLPGFYDDWVLSERTRLSDVYASVLSRIAGLAEQTGSLELAVDSARRLISLDPLQEEHHLRLINLYGLLGQRTSALRQYRELVAILRDELESEPSSATKKVVERIRGGAFEASRPGAVVSVDPHPFWERSAAPPAKPRLPVQLTKFLGREEELAQVGALVLESGNRITTLFGLGGCGKTRLAIEVGGRVAQSFEGSVWFVPLAEVGKEEQIAEAILNALDSRTVAAHSGIGAVAEAIERHGDALLILDNFEHLADAGVATLRALVERLPQLRILVTSRFTLNMDGENAFRVGPLAVAETSQSPEDLLQCPSAQLFVDRATAVQSGFLVTTSNMEALRELCERLDGLPLAIELAAAWSLTMSPEQILQGLNSRLDFLVSRRRDIAPRHRSLRSAIEYGYQLLPPHLQRLFTRLSVFQGGWTAESAGAVCEEESVIGALAELCERSLIKLAPEIAGGSTRYEMLDTLREFAWGQLSRDEQALLRGRHASCYAELVSSVHSAPSSPPREQWLDWLSSDHANLVAALEWCRESGDAAVGLRLALGCSPHWLAKGPLSEGITWFDRFLEMAGEEIERPLYAGALAMKGRIAMEAGAYTVGRGCLEEALVIQRALGDHREEVESLNHLGYLLFCMGDKARALSILEESMGIAERVGYLEGVMRAALNSGTVLSGLERYDEARERFEQGLYFARDLGSSLEELRALNGLGNVSTYNQRYLTAMHYYEECLRLAGDRGNKLYMASSQINIGNALEKMGQLEAGLRLIPLGVRLADEIGYSLYVQCGISSMAHIAMAVGEYEVAATLLGILEAWTESRHALPTVIDDFAETDVATRQNLSEQDYDAAKAAGRAMDARRSLAYSLSWASQRVS